MLPEHLSVRNAVQCRSHSPGLNATRANFKRVDEVPLRSKSVNDIGERYYKEPAPFHGILKVAVPPDFHTVCDPTLAKPISPPENTLAFIMPASEASVAGCCIRGQCFGTLMTRGGWPCGKICFDSG